MICSQRRSAKTHSKTACSRRCRRADFRPSLELLEDRTLLTAYSPAFNGGLTETDWMKNLPDSWTLNQLSIPGTHDSDTFSGLYIDLKSGHEFLNLIPGMIGSQSQTQ